MKSVLLLICVVSLLTTVGCIFPGHQGGADYQYLGHGEYREHSDIPAMLNRDLVPGFMRISGSPPGHRHCCEPLF